MTGLGTGVSPAVGGIIDSHHHVWDPAKRPHDWLAALPSLNRPFDLGNSSRSRSHWRVGHRSCRF